MNFQSNTKQTTKEMQDYLADLAPLMDKHKDNKVLLQLKKNLKKWIKRGMDAMEEGKRNGYPPEFERLWKAYGNRTGSKAEAYGIACKVVDDYEQVIQAAGLYRRDCEKKDQSLAHLTTWLNQKRFESYEVVKKEKPKCQVCKEKDFYERISVKDDNGKWLNVMACIDCKKYNRWTIQDVKGELG